MTHEGDLLWPEAESHLEAIAAEIADARRQERTVWVQATLADLRDVDKLMALIATALTP